MDCDNFLIKKSESKITSKYALQDKIVLIFHGALGYPPNKQAISILNDFILPSVLKNDSSVRLLLVGNNPPSVNDKNVIITGYVENLPEHIAAADIAVVPLLNGGGTRIKILEYMASGKPIVSTNKGAEGLEVENGLDILMSKNPDSEFIHLIMELIDKPELRKSIGSKARQKAELLYDWKQTGKSAFEAYVTLIEP